MCIAVPGRIIEKTDTQGLVDVRGNVLPVVLAAVDAEVGDYVLVHAGCAISKIMKSEADEIDELHRLIEECANG